jgi:hypothetical protein
MIPDPKPDEIRSLFHRKCPMADANSGRPQPANFLEMKGRMSGIGFEEIEILVRQASDFLGKLVVG